MTPDHLKNLALLDTIPQQYEADNGPHAFDSVIGTSTIRRFTKRALTPELNEYYSACVDRISGMQLTEPLHEEIEIERIQEICTSLWLSQRTGYTEWARVFSFFTHLAKHTLENNRVVKNIAINRDAHLEPGVEPLLLDLPKNAKILNWLGTSDTTYLRVSENLEVIGHRSVPFSEINDPSGYSFMPAFLFPITSQMRHPSPENPDRKKDVLVAANARGDLIVATQKEICASRRKGRWTVYDPPNVKNTILDCLTGGEATRESYGLACTLFQVLFDMSFKRHGGLIIVDAHAGSFADYTFGGVTRQKPSGLQCVLPTGNFDTTTPNQQDMTKLLEISAVDGAITMSRDGVVHGFGVMVRSEEGETGTFGARVVAARAAAAKGATAFCVSSDGEISIFFKGKEAGDSVHEIQFL
jgi:hypothetical protein